MTITSPWAIGFEPRLDKKCGASAIPDNAICRKGAGAATGGSRLRRGLENAAIVGGRLGSVGAALGSLKDLSTGNFKAANNKVRAANALAAIAEVGSYSKGKRTKDKKQVAESRNNLIGIGARMAISEGVGYGMRRSLNKYRPTGLPRTQKPAGSGKYRMANMRANIENRVARARGNAEGFAGRIQNRIGTIGYSRRSGPPRHSGYLPTSQAAPFRPRGRGRSGPWSAYGA